MLVLADEKYVDVCYATNLCFPGGNASSTLAETRACVDAGLSVALVHCPVKGNTDGPFSSRYADLHKQVFDATRSAVALRCRLLVVRHPSVALSPNGERLLARVDPQKVVVVINQSAWRIAGQPVFDPRELLRRFRDLPDGMVRFAPIGPVIREEWATCQPAIPLYDDWTPTFDLSEWREREPKPIGKPIVIGRHACDGAEKWPDTKEALTWVYPPSPDFSVRILGGASQVRARLGQLPDNWRDIPFGEMDVRSYLEAVDFFVYYPSATSQEAFGRSIVEAMLVGVPCVLPPSFRTTFGDTAIYSPAREVEAAIRQLVDDSARRTNLVRRARTWASEQFNLARFGSRIRELVADNQDWKRTVEKNEVQKLSVVVDGEVLEEETANASQVMDPPREAAQTGNDSRPADVLRLRLKLHGERLLHQSESERLVQTSKVLEGKLEQAGVEKLRATAALDQAERHAAGQRDLVFQLRLEVLAAEKDQQAIRATLDRELAVARDLALAVQSEREQTAEQEKKLASLQSDNAHLSTELAVTARDVQHLKELLEMKSGENAALSAALEEQRRGTQAAHQDLQNSRIELVEALQRARSAEHQAQSLRLELASSMAERHTVRESGTSFNGGTQEQEDGLRAQLAALREKEAQLSRANGQWEKKCSKLQEEVEKLHKQIRADENLGRDLVALVQTFQRKERRARSEVARGLLREERIRGHLSYRLGSAIVENGKTPKHWNSVPGAVRRAFAEYRRSQSSNTPSPSPAVEQADCLSLRNPVGYLPLKGHWERIDVRTVAADQELCIEVLAPSSSASFTIDCALSQAQYFEISDTHDVTLLEGTEHAGTRTFRVRMSCGQTRSLLTVKNTADGQVDLRFRKLTGMPCVLKLALKANGKEAPDSKRLPDSKPAVASRTSASNTLWRAQELTRQGKEREGIEFAAAHASGLETRAVHLLRANQSLHDDDAWVSHVNNYLHQFGISPIKLAARGPSRFHRILATAKHQVSSGPLVSVIMPAYNAQRTIEFAAQSILGQTWRPLELLIVDDGSTDSTWQIVQTMQRRDSRVRSLRNPVNVGPYVSKNLALAAARGTFLTGHDADDWAHPERIERHVREMIQSEGSMPASLTRMVRIEESGFFGHFSKVGRTSDDGVNRVASISCMFEASALRSKLGYWDSVRFGADSELIGRAQQVFGDGLVTLRQLGMLCLDAEGSLTNDPVHGVSKIHGISATRREYRDHWRQWHLSTGPHTSKLAFPMSARAFPAPDAAVVPLRAIQQVIASATASNFTA